MLIYVQSFIAVAKAAGFTNAARQTGISKAKLSRDVKELENQLGIQLLHRTSRTFALTEQGKQFFESCHEIEDIYKNAVENIKQKSTNISGTLKITAPIDFGIKFLAPVISDFCQTYPLMDIHLSLSNDNELLIEKQFDLAVRIANQLPDSNLRMLTLMEFKRIICAAPEYLTKHSLPATPDDLKNHLCTTIVNQNKPTINPAWALYDDDKLKNYTLNHFIECDSILLQKQLVTSGLCIGRISSYYIEEELKSGKLIELFPEIKNPATYVFLVYPNTISLPHKTRAFIDVIKNHLKVSR